MAAVIRQTRESLESGNALSMSMARQHGVFSAFYIAMVRIGELTGRLDEVFLRLFHHLAFEKLMREQVRTALRYPSFVVAVMAVAIVRHQPVRHPGVPEGVRGLRRRAAADDAHPDRLLAVHRRRLALAARRRRDSASFAFRAWLRTEDGRYVWDRTVLRLPIAGKIADARPLWPASRAASRWR